MVNRLIERDFCCRREGLMIRGREFLPQGDHLPAIIISHGFGGNSMNLESYCRTFAGWGYATYCFDFCGGCPDEEGRSDGKSTDMTVLTERDDLIAVMNYVKELTYVDDSKLTLMGFSQGGFVSALAAAKRANEVNSIILIYPAFCIPDDARRGALANSSYDINCVPEIIDCGKMTIGKMFHETVADMDPYEEIIPYTGPVLLIHGTSDEIVHYSYSVQAQNSYETSQCQLQLIKEAGHHFTEEQTESMIVSIHQFLKGKKEVLTIDVLITGSEVRKDTGTDKQIAVFFTGSSESPFFKGDIVQGAEDVQDYYEGNLTNIRADYALEGVDYVGDHCRIHIVNQRVNGELKPDLHTDSRALDFLNHADLTASIEGFTGGLTVRIFS
ncbi:hypothetical protein BK126_18455 [Paenibacillus sp. FSL H7-0326]|uniref:alpha/beta hydrolase n=1 Tax=Paenibacillus sp. FSL H7-0326 TaxID=1921144 RepID=UPI00096CAB8F|nr:alpha/beta fold hydrolase [Paenibacillus sp. FSL H7-0326]OMC67681.1 hypothetical protein BK126_18455 [Paenibacillus sp. FSL H7-0326]